VQIVLGHVGIFKALVSEARLNAEAESQLFEAVQRKAYDEIDLLLDNKVQDSALKQQFKELIRLSGDESVLARAQEAFAAASAAVTAELNELNDIVHGVKRRLGEIDLHFDLCELQLAGFAVLLQQHLFRWQIQYRIGLGQQIVRFVVSLLER
jgi:ATP phosphoribosyltransferase regulatory subunit